MNTLDARRATRGEQLVFRQVKLAENEYARKLRRLSDFIMRTARDMLGSGTQEAYIDFAHMMNGYSDIIRPWAQRVALRMIYDVSLRDLKAWRERAQEVSWNLEEVIRNAPIGLLVQQRLDDQLDLITSIPRDIAEEVHKMALASLSGGQRFGSISDMIQRKADTTLGRANLIARTEVARTTTEFTRARAEYVGSEGYIWRTAHDQSVRPLHRRLDGKYIRWDSPPISGERGERAHAGQIYNCRCIAEVVIPEAGGRARSKWEWSVHPDL